MTCFLVGGFPSMGSHRLMVWHAQRVLVILSYISRQHGRVAGWGWVLRGWAISTNSPPSFFQPSTLCSLKQKLAGKKMQPSFTTEFMLKPNCKARTWKMLCHSKNSIYSNNLGAGKKYTWFWQATTALVDRKAGLGKRWACVMLLFLPPLLLLTTPILL